VTYFGHFRIFNSDYCTLSVFISLDVAIRPPDILVGGFKFYRNSSPVFFFRYQLSELTERNSTKTSHMLGN